VVQQRQGRATETVQMAELGVNGEAGEREVDVMGGELRWMWRSERRRAKGKTSYLQHADAIEADGIAQWQDFRRISYLLATQCP